MEKTAICTGVRGQDGSTLSRMLLNRGFKVYGLIRRSSMGLDLGCSKDLEGNSNFEVVEGDLLDPCSLNELCRLARADLIFHCAAMSHVGSSFSQPQYTIQCNTIGTLNLLEAIRESGIHSRFLHCATSEMFGGVSSEPCNENTSFHPRSPYGVSKVGAYWITINYRESYKIFACNSICFNHEQPGARGPNFVTRKISLAIAKIKAGLQDKLYLGNLEAKRDWGMGEDFCKGMIKILESSSPQDYVLATGETHTVREFCEIAFNYAGLGDYRLYVEIDPKFYRPAEVDVLIGDYSKINKELGWKPETTFENLVKKMVDYDLNHI